MERSYNQRSQDHSQAGDALADIALNTLGLILIVLLIFVVLFSKATAQGELSGTNPDAATATAALQALQQENQDLTEKVAALSRDSQQWKEEDKSAGLWRFRIAVDGFVDHNDTTKAADFTIEYFVHLDIHGNQVRGTLFGVKEDSGSNNMGSATHANIKGTIENGQMQIELLFTGAATGGSEILQVRLQDNQFNGKLVSGKHKTGYQNYTGMATGTRLDGSAFAN